MVALQVGVAFGCEQGGTVGPDTIFGAQLETAGVMVSSDPARAVTVVLAAVEAVALAGLLDTFHWHWWMTSVIEGVVRSGPST